MKLAKALNIEDLRRMAKRRLPRIIFGYIDGGVEDEIGRARNVDAFRRRALLPRYLVDIAKRDQSATVFGRRYASPFGIAPTGMAAVARRDADLLLAAAAAEADIPFIISGGSTASIEGVAKVAPEHAWCQIYSARDPKISADMLRRAADAGIKTLVVTIDVPVGAKRENNIRDGWIRPYIPSRSAALEALTHPAWCLEYMRYGLPPFETWARYAEAGAKPRAVANFVSSQMPSPQSWATLESFRRLWPEKLVLKGVLHPDDARRAAELGADGVIVSNHGGRQLDRAPAALDMLPLVHAAVGDKMTVMLDSGIRRGSDVVIARCLGSAFTFVGRATLYGTAAAGLAGARRAIAILRSEIDTTLGQIGCTAAAELGRHFLTGETEVTS